MIALRMAGRLGVAAIRTLWRGSPGSRAAVLVALVAFVVFASAHSVSSDLASVMLVAALMIVIYSVILRVTDTWSS